MIREGVTIHRATRQGGETVVGDDCLLLAYAHVAHENRIGHRVVMANNVMLAGHVEIGERAVALASTSSAAWGGSRWSEATPR